MKSSLNLKYRFGFLATNNIDIFHNGLDGALRNWNLIEIGRAVLLSHYETKLVVNHFDNHILYTLGDIFVAHGYKTISENLKLFIEKDNYDFIDNLSGRFAILVFDKKINRFEKILNDPFGSRSLFYCSYETEIVASHSSLLAEVLQYKRNETAIAFIKTPDFRSINTKFLPADLTMYDGVYGVPANHYYSFENNNVVRFWPRAHIQPTDIDTLIKVSYEYFNNYVNYFLSAGLRPIFGLTAGVDSRLLIAVWKNRNLKFKCLTWTKGLSAEDYDIINKIKNHIRQDCYLLDTKKTTQNDYFEALKESGYINRGAFMSPANITAQTAEFIDENEVFVRGLGGEILRGMFNKSRRDKNNIIDNFTYAIKLFEMFKIDNPGHYFSDYLHAAYAGYFDRLRLNSVVLYNYDFGDLIYWEQRMSMWCSSLLNEGDPAVKNFAGINSRKMYETAYGLPATERFRRELLLKITAIYDIALSNMEYI